MENDGIQFENFWKIEDIATFPEFNSETISCSQHYEQTTTYGHDGRVIVRLPIKKSHLTIASNGSVATTETESFITALSQLNLQS